MVQTIFLVLWQPSLIVEIQMKYSLEYRLFLVRCAAYTEQCLLDIPLYFSNFNLWSAEWGRHEYWPIRYTYSCYINTWPIFYFTNEITGELSFKKISLHMKITIVIFTCYVDQFTFHILLPSLHITTLTMTNQQYWSLQFAGCLSHMKSVLSILAFVIARGPVRLIFNWV